MAKSAGDAEKNLEKLTSRESKALAVLEKGAEAAKGEKIVAAEEK